MQEAFAAPTGRCHLLAAPDMFGIGVEGRNGLWEQPDSSSPHLGAPLAASLPQLEGGGQAGRQCVLPALHHWLPTSASSSSTNESIKTITCRKDLSGKTACSEPGELPAKTLHKYRRKSQEIFFLLILKYIFCF